MREFWRAVVARYDIGLPLFTLIALSGCGSMLLIDESQPLPVGSPLRPAEASADGVRIEVYWATLPPSAEADGQAELWRFVQEERLDEELRLRLRRNGFRAGVVGGVPPEEIVRLLNPAPMAAGEEGQEAAPKLAVPTGVRKKEMTLRPGEPALLDASGLVPQTTLLIHDDGNLAGEPFLQARGVYRLGVKPRPGGGHTVSLAPEVHHGESRTRYVADGAGIKWSTPMQEERAFADLSVEAPLVVGEMLIVTSRGDYSASSLGSFFHRADGEVSGERKAIVVRLLQAPPAADFVTSARESDRPQF